MNIPLSLAQKISAHLFGPWGQKRWARLDRFFEWLDGYEMPMVRMQAAVARKPRFRAVAIAINRLGNGWLFVLCGIGLLGFQGWSAVPIVATALLALGIAHVLYPVMKSYIARPRPMDRYAELESLLTPLDRYSCPSGHCMSATALFVPIILVVPGSTVIFISLWLLIAWARLAAAHHYPSDIVLGALVGCSVAWPISRLCLT
jgi:undecaprenyl-diphosphatase